jgi:hypothetical protein
MSPRNLVAGACVATMLACASLAAQACGGDDGGSPAPPDAGTDAAALDDVTPPPPDARADGEAVTDGGSNIDPDASEDAGACAAALTLVNDAPATTSQCVSVFRDLGGGAIVPGKYHLAEVRAIATKAFCDTQFIPVGFRETAQIDPADAAGSFAVETVLQLADGAPRRSTATLTPGPGNTSPMQVDPTCPDNAAGPVRYASGVRPETGRQAVVMLLPYGKGAAYYVFDRAP